jgi:hypothetical protein
MATKPPVQNMEKVPGTLDKSRVFKSLGQPTTRIKFLLYWYRIRWDEPTIKA